MSPALLNRTFAAPSARIWPWSASPAPGQNGISQTQGGQRGEQPALSPVFKENNRAIAQKILSTSVSKNALKTVGTPFLYKPSRILGAMEAKNNQETRWGDSLDADNFDV